jgi:hypothetical protein
MTQEIELDEKGDLTMLGEMEPLRPKIRGLTIDCVWVDESAPMLSGDWDRLLNWNHDG